GHELVLGLGGQSAFGNVRIEHRHEGPPLRRSRRNLGCHGANAAYGAWVVSVNSGMLQSVSAERARYSAENCSIRRTLDVVGEKWTLLVLREAFYGVRRFDDFVRGVGCARNILSARLNTLVDEGLLRRRPYREPGQRARVEYRITEKGLELFPAIVSLMQWGDRWAVDPDGPPVEIVHR